MDPLIVVFGLGVGILVGMTGVGGGSLMTPLLILVFGVKPVLAIGTDLGFAASASSRSGSPPANHASRISSRSAGEVVRSESARTFASFQRRAPSAVGASAQSAARIPPTLFAAIDAPVPVQQQTTAWSARPSATSRAAASEAHAQSGRSPSASAPCTSGS